MKKPETKFKEKVIARLQATRNVWFLKTQEVARRGTPDLIICAGGKFVAWELKVDGEVTELQMYNLNKISHWAHGIGRVVTPENFEECFNELRGFL